MTNVNIVSQDDREAAASLFHMVIGGVVGAEKMRAGEIDNHSVVQAFAHHRLAALEEAAKEAYRVCAETRHVTLGDKVVAAILALRTKEPSRG